MAPKRKVGEDLSILELGAQEGEEVLVGQPHWATITGQVGSVLEAAIEGSSVNVGHEGWFAVLVRRTSLCDTAGGLLVAGDVLGSDSNTVLRQVAGILADGYVHLCPDDPCISAESQNYVHVQKVRCWSVANFTASYLSEGGEAILRKAKAASKRVRATPKAPTKKREAKDERRPALRKKKAAAELDVEGVIDVAGSEEEYSPEDPPGVDKEGLRKILRDTRERILGGTAGGPRRKPAETVPGGHPQGNTPSAADERRLVAGTSLNPRLQTPLALGPSAAPRGDGSKSWMKSLALKEDASSRLLAQAVQASQREARIRKEKKRKKDKGDGLKRLVELLQGKKKKKKKKKRSDGGEEKRQGDRGYPVKPDPEGGADPGSSDSSSSSSSGDGRRGGDQSEAESELSCEPPLRRRALKEPGSVMELLVRHAQEQLDRGSLLEAEGSQPGMTSGIKV